MTEPKGKQEHDVMQEQETAQGTYQQSSTSEREPVQQTKVFVTKLLASSANAQDDGATEEPFVSADVEQELALLLAEDAEDIDLPQEELYAMAGLLRHSVAPATLSAQAMNRIEGELWQELSLVSKPQQAEAGWLERAWAWLWPRPMMAMAAAALVVMMGVGVLRPWLPGDLPEPRLELAQQYDSPWKAGENPFQKTKNASERLEKVFGSLTRQRQDRWMSHLRSRQILGQRF